MRFSGFKESLFSSFFKKKPPVAQFAPPVAQFAPEPPPEEDASYFDFDFQDDTHRDKQGHPAVTMYRGLAGSYIPPGPKADQYMRDWEAKLQQMFGGDERKEIQYLKKIGKYAVVSGLQRRNAPQSATTNIEQAIDFAIKESKKKNGTPYVVKIKVPQHEADHKMIKGGGQTGFDVYEFTAEEFANFYELDGETMDLRKAQAELAKTQHSLQGRHAQYHKDIVTSPVAQNQNPPQQATPKYQHAPNPGLLSQVRRSS